MRIRPAETGEVANLSAEKGEDQGKWTKITNIQRWHEELGHMGEHTCRIIAKQVNVELTKKAMKTCESKTPDFSTLI